MKPILFDPTGINDNRIPLSLGGIDIDVCLDPEPGDWESCYCPTDRTLWLHPSVFEPFRRAVEGIIDRETLVCMNRKGGAA